MSCAGKIAICLAGGLVLSASLRADDVVLAGNPYAPVVERNIFGLVPPPPPVDPNAQPPDPPVKITPNGIMSIFGQLQVLFKVAKPGKPAANGDDSYILSEGQQQDDIEVVKIDEKAGVVTFNNHGIVQALPLVPGVASSTPMPGSPVAVGNPGLPGARPGRPGGIGGPNGFITTFGNRGGNLPGINHNVVVNGGNNPGASGINGRNSGLTGQSVPANNSNAGQGNSLTPEEQMILMAAQHAKAQQEGNPMAAIFPPTPIDADAGVVPTPPPPAP